MKGVKLVILVMCIGLLVLACQQETLKEEPLVLKDQVPLQQEVQSKQQPVMIRQEGHQLSFLRGDYFVFIDVLNEGLIKIDYRLNGTMVPQTEAVERRHWTGVDYTYDLSEDWLVIKSQSMTLKMHVRSLETQVFYQDQWVFTQAEVPKVAFALEFDHPYHGLYGMDGIGAQENTSRKMLSYQGGRLAAGQQGDAGGPFAWQKNFGLYFDTVGGRFDVAPNHLSVKDQTQKNWTYYAMVGPPLHIMENMYQIAGTAPMFPKWSLGFTNSEWGLDQEELESIIATYREKEIPLDHFTLDFDWKAWGEDDYGEFRWNEEKFPGGSKGLLKAYVEKMGVHLTGIFKPRILTETVQGAYAKRHGFFYPGRKDYREYFSKELANDIDFSNPAASVWYFSHTKHAIDTGIEGFWNDEADELGDNLQHLLMQKALYIGQRAYNEKRVWSINRNFFTGAQRYAYGLWSGDIQSSVAAMQDQRQAMLTAINLGQAKWGMDTGGFNGPKVSEEQYARWLQFSAFTPIYRVHGRQDVQQQPWVYGDKAVAVARAVSQWRYTHLPYLYSYERRAYDTGLGLVTPLFYHHPDDKNLDDSVNGWYVGDHYIVYPVLTIGQAETILYLPKGLWRHAQTGRTYEGGQEITLATDQETWQDIPLFIKEGAIIPTQEMVQYVSEKVINHLSITVFPHEKETSFTVYDDDGETYAYEDTGFFKQVISQQQGDEVTHIKIHAASGRYITPYQTYTFTVYQTGETLTYNGKQLPFDRVETPLGSGMRFLLPVGQAGEIIITN